MGRIAEHGFLVRGVSEGQHDSELGGPCYFHVSDYAAAELVTHKTQEPEPHEYQSSVESFSPGASLRTPSPH